MVLTAFSESSAWATLVGMVSVWAKRTSKDLHNIVIELESTVAHCLWPRPHLVKQVFPECVFLQPLVRAHPVAGSRLVVVAEWALDNVADFHLHLRQRDVSVLLTVVVRRHGNLRRVYLLYGHVGPVHGCDDTRWRVHIPSLDELVEEAADLWWEEWCESGILRLISSRCLLAGIMGSDPCGVIV